MFDFDNALVSPEDAEEILTSNEFNFKPGTHELKVAKILIFSMWAGENLDQLSVMSGIPIDECNAIAAVLEKNGVFGKGINHREEYCSESGGINMQMDIACGMNHCERTGGTGASASFKMTQAGIDSVHRDLITNPEAREFMDGLDKAHGLKPGTTRGKLSGDSGGGK